MQSLKSESDRLLAEVWRDLAGWHVGMVTAEGYVVFLMLEEGEGFMLCHPNDYVLAVSGEDYLPDLNSLSNWGHWIVFVHHKVGELEIELAADCSVACSYDMDTWHADESMPLALLESFCAHMDNMVKHGLEESRPPSVLAWWKSQQGEVSGG